MSLMTDKFGEPCYEDIFEDAPDSDLAAARDYVAHQCMGYSESIRAGESRQEWVDAVLAGIKLGREIERSDGLSH